MISLSFHWLLTYLFHSSVLLAGAALLDWRRRLTARGLGSTLWRIALFGGFVTASVQPAVRSLLTALWHGSALPSLGAASAEPIPALALPPLQADAIDLAPLLVPVWLVIAIGGLAWLFTQRVRVARLVARMAVVSSPGIERRAHALALRARIPMPRMRVGAMWQAPFVAPGRVICIPAWMLDRYQPTRLKAALAHEFAHLQRHDNEWRIASRIAAIAGWLQPFNWLAIRRMEDSAEIACDAWAATSTGLRLELACSLEDCAIRLGSSPQFPALAIGMAAPRFRLLERVTQLLEDSDMNTRLKRAACWSSVALLVIAVSGIFIVITTLDDDVPPRWLAANGLYQSLRNVDQHVHRSRSVIVKSPEQYVYIRVTEGFSIAAHDPAQVRGGTAVISETRGGVTRTVRYERGDFNELRLTYRVNGSVQTLNAEGARWLATMMPIAAPAFSRS